MKTMGFIYNKLAYIFLAGLLFLTPTINLAEEIVRLASGEWPPYTSKRIDRYGIYSHIVSAAFALEGIKVEYGFSPWARSYLQVVDGSWDGSLTWALTPEKEKQVLFSDPVFHHKKVFFHLKNSYFEWRTFDDLKDVKIGATRKYTYSSEFDQAVRNGTIDVVYTTSDIQNFKKLFFGRLDIFPSDIEVGYELLNANFTPEQVELIAHHPKPVQVTHTHVIFSKKNPEKSQRLLKLFNSGLKKLRESGRYDELLEEYRRQGFQHK